MIFTLVLVKQREASRTAPNRDEMLTKKDDVFRLTGFRAAFAFDVAQTEGKPLPEFVKTTGDPGNSEIG